VPGVVIVPLYCRYPNAIRNPASYIDYARLALLRSASANVIGKGCGYRTQGRIQIEHEVNRMRCGLVTPIMPETDHFARRASSSLAGAARNRATMAIALV